MNLDGILLYRYTQEVKKLLPLKINKIQQLSNDRFIFQVRNKKNYQLLISLDPQTYRFHFTEKQYNTSFEPSSFLMLLRKYLTQAMITEIFQPKGDRVIVFTIETLNHLKDKVSYQLYLEFFGKYTNCILVNAQQKIVDCLKRTAISSNRSLYPGIVFEPTHDVNKAGIFEQPHLPITAYNGLSKLAKDEIQYRNISIETFQNEILKSNTIYYYPEKNVFHVIPLTHLHQNSIQYPLSTALDAIYHHQENQKRINEISGNIQKYVKKEIEKSTLKLEKLKQTYQQALDYEKYAHYADILFMHAHLKQHATSITLEDFEGNLVQIPLDEKLSVKDNAHKYYKQYAKAKKALTMLQIQIEKTKETIHYYETIQSQLEIIQLEDAIEIAEELKLTTKKQIQTKKQKHPNFLLLKVDNVEIYVGKNNIQNDYITNKISKKHYLWFHVKDFHGSHVVVNQSEVSEKILRLCATLAAYFSKARYSSSIPVNYCLLKQLKATRGNQIGMVFLGHYKTIYIDVDENALLATIEKYQVK